MKARPVLTPQEEAAKRTRHKRDQRRRQRERRNARIAELESQNKRLLSAAARALERCEVATDPSGAADEAAFILREVVEIDGSYVPWDPDRPMFRPPPLDPDLRAGKH